MNSTNGLPRLNLEISANQPRSQASEKKSGREDLNLGLMDPNHAL